MAVIDAPRIIRWVPTERGAGENPQETDCGICWERTESQIIGHRLDNAARDIGHRFHRDCLVAFPGDRCPSCMAPYHRWEIPNTLAERVSLILSDIKGRVVTSFIFYGLTGVVAGGFCTVVTGIGACLFVPSMFVPLTISCMMGNITGMLIAATTQSLVMEISWYAGKQIIHWIFPQNPTTQKVLLLSVALFAVTSSVWITTILASALEAQMVAQLVPKAKFIYSYLLDPFSRPYPGSLDSRFWAEAFKTYGFIFHLSMQSGIVLGTAFSRKAISLLVGNANLDPVP